MNKILFTLFVTILGCSNNPKDIVEDEKDMLDNKISLKTDTINVVKLTDTLVIYESTCRGCAYERSTNFTISDSLNIIKLEDVITIDNNSPDMDGGSMSKDLILVPVKTGSTNIKVYKFWTMDKTAKDSARFVTYNIEVKS